MHRCKTANVIISIYATFFAVKAAANATAEDCPCGYYDTTTGSLWTEAIIVYFNETTSTPVLNFVEESYSHAYEKGWSTLYRTGADADNIDVSNSTSPESPKSLELSVSPYRSDHLVVGSSLRTSRRDVLSGSFTSLLRSPGQFAGGGGSVLSFAVEFNSSQSISTNLQNTDKPSTASVSTLVNGESPDNNSVVYDEMIHGDFGNGTLSPWEYTEYRIEWTENEAKHFLGGYLARSVSRSEEKGLLSVPSPINLRHWSNGLATGSQGPPKQRTTANVGWLRYFFNSSLMTEGDHAGFDSRCRTVVTCSVGDMTLRGSSVYSNKSMEVWKQQPMNRPRRVAAIWLAVGCISLTTFLLLSPIWIRVRERWTAAQEIEMTPQLRRESRPLTHSRAESPEGLAIDFKLRNKTTESIGSDTIVGTNRSSPTAASFDTPRSTSSLRRKNSRTFRRRSAYIADRPSNEEEPHEEGQSDSQQKALSENIPPGMEKPATGISLFNPLDKLDFAGTANEEGKEQAVKLSPSDKSAAMKEWRSSWHSVGWGEPKTSTSSVPSAKSPVAPEVAAVDFPKESPEVSENVTKAFPEIPEGGTRVHYLAGLLVISCLLVTAINFNLTFVYGDLMSDGFDHSHSQVVARKTVNSFLLNPIWIGPFLLISARFLSAEYLRSGDVLAIAEKTVKRTFRLMLPVTAMVMLEYFFVDCGATKWLEYLPSITWSTWPFIKGYSNFGNFLSEILELVYLIPNATPVITINYCTHVLWSIPVLLQGSWTTLLAVVVIREIKVPWKRFGFYAFCIANHWYALSWGSYFYFGIMLADLEITYKWQYYLHSRLFVYYLLLLLCICFALGGPTLDLLSQQAGVDYAAYEYGIHANLTTGLPISTASRAVSPGYFFPRLHGLVFVVGLQAAVDLSPLFQKLFSLKLLMLISPHVFTIYLLHGFIFWTFGPWLCVFLAVRGLSYWSNILVVALCCYTALALTTPLVTPVLDSLGKSVTTDIWRRAREEPAPRRPTLYPFPKDLFLNREEISWERKPSKDIGTGPQELRISKAIPRVRKPSKDMRTSWYEPESSASNRVSWLEQQPSNRASWLEQQPSNRASWLEQQPSNRASWLEQQPAVDPSFSPQERRMSRATPRDPKPAKDVRQSWDERNLPEGYRASWHEGESSGDGRSAWLEQEPVGERRSSASQDNRISWHERKASKTGMPEIEEDVDEEPDD